MVVQLLLTITVTKMNKLMKFFNELTKRKCLNCDIEIGENKEYWLRYPNDIYCSEKCGNKNY
jgi:hypothetical protein